MLDNTVSPEALRFFFEYTAVLFIVLVVNEILCRVWQAFQRKITINQQRFSFLITLDQCFDEWRESKGYVKFGDFCFNKRMNGWKII